MAVGLSIRNLFVLTLIGSFAYTVYSLPISGVEQRLPGRGISSNNNHLASSPENPWDSSTNSLKKKKPYWQPQCNKINNGTKELIRHRRSPKQVKQVLSIMIKRLNHTFQTQINKLYKEPMTRTPRYDWLPKKPGKKMREISPRESYGVFYTRLQEYAVILYILNQTGPPVGYGPNQFDFNERHGIINSIAHHIRQILCELEFTMKGKTEFTQVDEKKFDSVIPRNLNNTQLYVYDMATFNAYKKFLISWRRVWQKRRRNSPPNINDKDNKKKGNKKKNNPIEQKRRKGPKNSKLANGLKGKNKKVPSKQQKKQPK